MQITTGLSEELNRYLDLASAQLKMTAQNMANVDTPGYRTVGFDFESEMRKSLDTMSRGGSVSSGVSVSQVDGLLERPDGNNVSMDREGLEMAKAQLQFRTGVDLLKHQYSRLLNVIHEDSK